MFIPQHLHNTREILLDAILNTDIGIDQSEKELHNWFKIVIFQIPQDYSTNLLIIVVKRQEFDNSLNVGSQSFLI